MAVTAGGGDANTSVSVAAGTVHTLVVLDGANGLEIDNLTDAAGSGEPPAGGVHTGFGLLKGILRIANFDADLFF